MSTRDLNPKVLEEQTLAALSYCSTDAMITFKPMFGGILGYADGKPLVSLSNVGLAVKLAPNDQEELLGNEGAERLRYEESDPPSKQYVLLPQDWLTEPKLLAPWIERSVAYVQSLPAKNKK